MKYPNIKEEELKNKVAQDYFWFYDCTKIIGNIDFCVALHQSHKDIFETDSLLWAEAKKGASDIFKSLVQLILTIGKARTFDKFMPPSYLGAFDAEKIAFIPYNDVQEIFYLNDFNWNVAPSNHETKEFQLIHDKVKSVIESNALLFFFILDDLELRKFIKINLIAGKFGISKTQIDKNNFIIIYNKWLQTVKPTIAVNWEIAKQNGIIDGDFYLADLLSSENYTLKEKLFVLLKKDHYLVDRKITEMGMFSSLRTDFTDNQVAHTQFWNKYERPPREDYWDYIIERRDLLVPQDIRERKGSFFTPQIWVELSQKYLKDVLGEDWQNEYYIWDCAAGTGNLLAGLTNKYNIYASTLDKQDVDVMHDRIQNGANLVTDHVFQFDFLNDDFIPVSKGGKIPDSLYKIISHPEKRKKLVIYINPPYAEVSSVGIKSKAGVNQSKIHDQYLEKIGTAGREVFTLFFARIYNELNGCILAEFSKLKVFNGSAFAKFRNFFNAKLLKSFIIPAYTFDNVNGKFPIGFKIWNTSVPIFLEEIVTDVFNENGRLIGQKNYTSVNKNHFINRWISKFNIHESLIGFLAGTNSNDFQNNRIVYILNQKEQMANPRGIWISHHNLIPVTIYFSVRHCIEATWLNDRDQFLFPNDGWKTDTEFHNDCLVYTLFHHSNRITSKEGINHWIPFSEQEVNAKERFDSNFMSQFIKGKIKPNDNQLDIFSVNEPKKHYEMPLKFSQEAQSVLDAGLELWKYYQSKPKINANASFYDIKEYFQGRNEKGKMNNKSSDEKYNELMDKLRLKIRILGAKIEPKVYLYGFLK